MGFTVRHARQADLPAVQSLTCDSWRAAYAELLPADALAFIADESRFLPIDALADALESDELTVLVAAEADRVVGEIQFAEGNRTHAFVSPSEGEVQLQSLYVDPDHWRRGIGSQLVATGIEAAGDGYDAVLVEVLSENNTARRFYRSQGFEPVDERTVELFGLLYGSTIMRKELR